MTTFSLSWYSVASSSSMGFICLQGMQSFQPNSASVGFPLPKTSPSGIEARSGTSSDGAVFPPPEQAPQTLAMVISSTRNKHTPLAVISSPHFHQKSNHPCFYLVPYFPHLLDWSAFGVIQPPVLGF